MALDRSPEYHVKQEYLSSFSPFRFFYYSNNRTLRLHLSEGKISTYKLIFYLGLVDSSIQSRIETIRDKSLVFLVLSAVTQNMDA